MILIFVACLGLLLALALIIRCSSFLLLKGALFVSATIILGLAFGMFEAYRSYVWVERRSTLIDEDRERDLRMLGEIMKGKIQLSDVTSTLQAKFRPEDYRYTPGETVVWPPGNNPRGPAPSDQYQVWLGDIGSTRLYFQPATGLLSDIYVEGFAKGE